MKVKKLLVVLLIMGLMVTVVGCGAKQETKPAEEKVYLVATEPTFEPFEFVVDGKITGFDIELIQAIAEAAGIKIQIQELGFEALIPALQSGNIDIAISGMTITPEREQSVDFGVPYFDAGLAIAVSADNSAINSVEDLKDKVAAVQIGTTGALKAEELKNAGLIKEVKVFNTVPEAFLEMKNAGADVVINDLPVTEAYISKGNKDVKVTGAKLDPEQYGFAVAEGNKELLEKLNDGLKKVKDSGKYEELLKKYF